MKDGRGHLHDALGRFARTGAVKVERDGPRSFKRAKARPETDARKKWDHARERVRNIDEGKKTLQRGEHVTDPDVKEVTYWRGRTAAPEHRYEHVLDRPEALHRAISGQRGTPGSGWRYGTKRTAGGKAIAERGWKVGREFPDGVIRGFGKRTRILNSAGTKSEAPKRGARKVFSAAAKAYRPRHAASDDS